ncbi:MAG: hypothetical protein KJ949_01845 [Nanoarchaeota archaeon]|nr:hypothetical protein [Nanoarchaeota archaeon]
MVNKKGWIRIIEAFVAVLLISSVLLIVLNRNSSENKNFSAEIYKSQVGILTEIQLNSSLRNEILKLETLPVEWAGFSELLQMKINETKLDYLICEGKICAVDELCELSLYEEKDIYAKSVIITANSEEFNPRQLKLFCWKN